MTVLSVTQLDMLRAVKTGRVSFGAAWKLDGAEADLPTMRALYGLVTLGLIDCEPGDVAVLRPDGVAVLTAAAEIAAMRPPAYPPPPL